MSSRSPRYEASESLTATSSPRGLLTRLEAELAEGALDEVLELGDERIPSRLWDAALLLPLREFFERPGKQFRSKLLAVAYRLCDATEPPPEELGLIVEVLHAGSLIVDDIEDGSRERRGRPALHVVSGLPVALNLGNWLYFLPHQLLLRLRLPLGVELAMRRAIESNVLRCHYGQALDLATRMGSLQQRDVFDVVSLSTRLKTGSLMELSTELGGLGAGGTKERVQALRRFGRAYGVGLQMLDDVSGLYQPARQHKGHEDLRNGRPTWPWAWLSRRLDEVGYSRLSHRAREVEQGALDPEELARALRKHLAEEPYSEIHERLTVALDELSRHFEDRTALEPLRAEMEQLERAYG